MDVTEASISGPEPLPSSQAREVANHNPGSRSSTLANVGIINCEIMVQISCTFENGSTQPCLFKSDIVQSTPPETFSERAPQLLITA
eukprot:m.185076 g.185076  ORF g.185076 m.185076 type:complete len:87 (+) comp24716_c0_seq1:166-426(+)